MYIISITNITDSQAKTLGYLTGMKVIYDKRFKRHELRGSKHKHSKYLKIIEEFAKLHKSDIRDWVAKDNQYKSENQFIQIK